MINKEQHGEGKTRELARWPAWHDYSLLVMSAWEEERRKGSSRACLFFWALFGNKVEIF